MTPGVEFLGLFCHQIPERSPHFGDAVFPVCFRCAGLRLGLAASYVTLATGGWRRRVPDAACASILAALALPFLVDGWGNALHAWDSPGWLRGLTGLGLGVMLPLVALPLAWRDLAAGASKPTLSHPLEAFAPLAAGGVLFALVLAPPFAWTFDGLGVVAALGELALIANVAWVAGSLARPARSGAGTRRAAPTLVVAESR